MMNIMHERTTKLCVRYVDYSKLYNEKTKTLLSLNDMINNENIRKDNE